jgi:NAD(P)-dependent dehydrogenase (short-subunit alcohol dehydrogenase family)
MSRNTARIDTRSRTVTNRAAIVTGASSGIGLAIAKALLEHGYGVVATSRNASRCGELAGNRNVAFVDGDVGRQPATLDGGAHAGKWS